MGWHEAKPNGECVKLDWGSKYLQHPLHTSLDAICKYLPGITSSTREPPSSSKTVVIVVVITANRSTGNRDSSLQFGERQQSLGWTAEKERLSGVSFVEWTYIEREKERERRSES